MLNFKSGLFVTVGLVSATFALDANATTRVTPLSQPVLAQTVADADGPTTGGGDTPYLSTKPAKPAEPAQAATPAPAPTPDTAATTPPTAAPTAPVKAAEPVVPPASTPSPAAAEAAPVPTTAATAEKTQSPATPVPVATPTPQPAPETPVQAATPAPTTPVPAAAPTPQPIKPQIPLQVKTPAPVEPQVPVQASTPELVAPATPPPAVATQPQPSQTPVVGAQDQKPKQQLAKKKPKPVHKPDVVVRNVMPRGPVHRVPDDNDMVYEDSPVPPMPIGRRHVVIEADNGYDDGYVVIRRYHRCEPHIVSGYWPFHREVRCY